MSKIYTPDTAALGVEQVLRLLEGRWKLVILFHLFDGKVQRYSDFGRLIPRHFSKDAEPATPAAGSRRNRIAEAVSASAA